MIAPTDRKPVRHYTVAPADQPPALDGTVRGTPWQAARVLAVDQYPWYAGGRQQATRVRLLYDADHLYAQFRCQDAHSFAAETNLNGEVYLDSCVEMFAGVDEGYFNLEINCCGTMHLGFGPGRRGRKLVDAVLAGQIKIASSLAVPTKIESPDDAAWWIAGRLPWSVLRAFTGRELTPRPGAVWRGNFYRCGGRVDPQHACWSPIDPRQHPEPDFHRPEYFGRIEFA